MRTITINTPGPQGPVGPQGIQGPSGSVDTSFLATTGSNTFIGNQTIAGNVTVSGTASINTLVVNQTALSTGSNQLGDAANDTQTLYGSVVVPTGSLIVSGNVSFGTSSVGFYWNNTNGRLGIGTSSPAASLHVTGEIRVNAGQSVTLDTSNNI